MHWRLLYWTLLFGCLQLRHSFSRAKTCSGIVVVCSPCSRLPHDTPFALLPFSTAVWFYDSYWDLPTGRTSFYLHPHRLPTCWTPRTCHFAPPPVHHTALWDFYAATTCLRASRWRSATCYLRAHLRSRVPAQRYSTNNLLISTLPFSLRFWRCTAPACHLDLHAFGWTYASLAPCRATRCKTLLPFVARAWLGSTSAAWFAMGWTNSGCSAERLLLP